MTEQTVAAAEHEAQREIAGAGTPQQRIAKLDEMKQLIVQIEYLEGEKADKVNAINTEIKKCNARLHELAQQNDDQFEFNFQPDPSAGRR